MGVLNRTPDSFSDGGRFEDLATALDAARRLIADGADILDIGGESTRPGAQEVGEGEELDRVLPLIEAVRDISAIPISVDTRKPGVARAAVLKGAGMWNDVGALSSPSSLQTAAELECQVVLGHMQGAPGAMQANPYYQDVTREVSDYLLQRAEAAVLAGVKRDRILIDPGLGFGKTAEHNLILIAHLHRLAATGFPMVLGASRKRFIQAVDPKAVAASDRLGGSLAVALAGARAGCAILRVHDVRETVQALKLQWAIQAACAADQEVIPTITKNSTPAPMQ